MYQQRGAHVDFLAAGIGNVVGIIVFCLVAAGVMKLFQISATLTEIKDSLARGGAHSYAAQQPAGVPSALASGEEMLRALDREMHLDESQPGVNPEIVNPR
jgi:hypothetical protein